jgi:hypothetical protein
MTDMNDESFGYKDFIKAFIRKGRYPITALGKLLGSVMSLLGFDCRVRRIP